MFKLLVQIILIPKIYRIFSHLFKLLIQVLTLLVHFQVSLDSNAKQLKMNLINLIHKILLTNVCYIDTSISANKLVCANLKTHHSIKITSCYP